MSKDEGTPVSPPSLPEGVLAVRMGPGANCSSAGSAIDILFYGSVIASALAVALAAAFPPKGMPGKTDAKVSEDEH
jgi:hypothetical protein